MVALKAGNILVETTYASTANKSVTVELVDGTGATACASRVAIVPAVSQTLTFIAADAGRKASALMTVTKAYANLRCRVTDTNQVPTVQGCSTDNFAVRPVSLALTATGLNADASGVSASATPTAKAGVNFTLTATASDAGYTGIPTIDVATLAAHTGAVRNGTLTGTLPAAIAGVASASFTYDDAGYFMLTANGLLDTTFTAVDSASGDCTADFSTTLVGGFYGCKVGSAATTYFGRFIPDHFAVTTASNGSMKAAVNNSFTYTGQPMTYATTPSLTITAMNGLVTPTITQNYIGAFQKLIASGVVITTPTADGTQNGKDGLTKTILSATLNAGALANNGSGTLTYTLASADSYTYTRNANAMIAPYTSGIQLPVTLVSEPASDGVAATGTLPTLIPTGVLLRYGRIKLANAVGSNQSPLTMTAYFQYFDGVAWQKNSGDTSTLLTLPGALSLTGAAISNVLAGTTSFAGGFNFTLQKPTASGVVTVNVNPANVPAWLNDATGTGTATFGVFTGKENGTKNFIYMRESY